MWFGREGTTRSLLWRLCPPLSPPALAPSWASCRCSRETLAQDTSPTWEQHRPGSSRLGQLPVITTHLGLKNLLWLLLRSQPQTHECARKASQAAGEESGETPVFLRRQGPH